MENRKVSLETKGFIRECKDAIKTNNFERANELLDYIVSKNEADTYSINFLNSYLMEKIEEVSVDFSSENRKRILLESGIKFLNEKKYDESMKVFNHGLEVTRENIFNYYIGKCYYKMNNKLNSIEYVNKSIKHFEDYLKNGYSKLEKASMYLMFLYAKTDNKTKQYEYEQLTNRINKFKGKDFKTDARNLYNTTENGIKINNKETYDVLNEYKKYIMELITNGDTIYIDEYLNTIPDDKRIIVTLDAIVVLYKYGYKKIANYYMKKIKLETKKESEKKIFNEIQKSKIMYIKHNK